MRRNGIYVWREEYPFEHFEEDIAAGRMMLLEREDSVILAAFSLREDKEGADSISWSNPDARALYIERFGTYPHCSSREQLVLDALHRTACMAIDMGVRSLRLLEIHGNTPAMRAYMHAGFNHAEGDMTEKAEGRSPLWLHGFELDL